MTARWDTLKHETTRSHKYSGCRFCNGRGCLACPGERLKANTGNCHRCDQHVSPPDKINHCTICFKPLCVPCFADDTKCQDCEDIVVQDGVVVRASDGFAGELAGAFAAGAKANKFEFEDDAGKQWPLGVLYRDWLSVRDGDQSAYPSDETLAKYQRWAEQLIAGGEREQDGAEFRRFARLRQGQRYMDLMDVGDALAAGRDCRAPDGWEILREPVAAMLPTDELYEAMKAAAAVVDGLAELDPEEQLVVLARLQAEVDALEADKGWIMGGTNKRTAQARVAAKRALRKTEPKGLIDGMLGNWDGNIRIAGGAPSGSLSIIYLEGEKEDILWHGDVKHFVRYGQKQFFAAWKWLEDQAANMRHSTIRVLHKDFAGGLYVTRHSEVSEGEMLVYQMCSTYCDPSYPDDWPDAPGRHLAALIRELLRRAYSHAEKEATSSHVFYADVMRWYAELMDTHPVFCCIAPDKRGKLWNAGRWISELGLKVTKRRRYTYIAPANRRLAKAGKNDKIWLLQALGESKGVKRTNSILSQLEDKGWLPAEYIPTRAKARYSEAEIERVRAAVDAACIVPEETP